MKQAYRRVTDLFVEGTEVVLAEPEGRDPVVVWVQKLNPFQREECVRDGQAARSRLQLTLNDGEPSDELVIFRAQTAGLDGEQLKAAIVDAGYAELFMGAQNSLRDDPDWTEKLQVLDRSDEQLTDRADDDPEVVHLGQLNRDYIVELERRVEARREGQLAELAELKAAELQRRYEQRYIEAKGTAEFLNQFRQTELFYAARACQAKRGEEGWEHGKCDHGTRLFDHRAEIREAPAELLERLRTAVDALAMSPRDAKNSARQGSSSGPSPLPSQPAPSTASGPDATSLELVGTSPSPPATP